jgi:hypothetical protein
MVAIKVVHLVDKMADKLGCSLAYLQLAAWMAVLMVGRLVALWIGWKEILLAVMMDNEWALPRAESWVDKTADWLVE